MGSKRERTTGQNGCVDEPLQLIEFVRSADSEGNTTIKLVDETLDYIIKRAGNRPLSTICVCGPSRQGKSFLLGYMIRCLEAAEKEETDWMDWDNRTKALKGFKFRNGTKPETQGIWVWSRPFIVKNDEDEEIAVLLIDTQGTCDAFTTNKDMSAIVGLSLLTSSVMIFNFFTNLQEDILTAMNTYTQYGQLALENSSDTPFQKLIFLIRDWNMPGEYAFGSKGGKTFIQDKLKITPEHSPEAKQVRETIRECFQELDCFLMPAIGEKALATEFTGSIAEVAPNFAKRLEEFVTSLMTSESLLVKEILGNVVTAKELKSYLNNYLEVFNSSELPSAKTMWEATSDVHNSQIVKKSVQKFNDLVNKSVRGKPYLLPEDLEKSLKTAEKQALEIFKQAKKFGSKTKIAEYEEELDDFLSQRKTDVKKQNEEKRNNYISEVLNEATSQFQKLLEGALPLDEGDLSTFYEDSEIKGAAIQAEDKVITKLKENLEGETREMHKTQVESLEVNLDSILASQMNKNKAIRAEAEKAIQKIVDALATQFETKLGELLDAYKYVEFENLIENVDNFMNSILNTWESTNKPGIINFHQSYETKLKEELGRISRKLQNEHTVHLQECQLKGNDYIQKICTGYEQKMAALVNDIDCVDKLKEIHKRFESEIIENFIKTGNPYPANTPLHTQLIKNLEGQLQNIFESGQKEALQLQQICEESYRQAVEKAKKIFDEKMQEIFNTSDFLSEKELEAEYKRVFYESIKIFENSEKSGQFDFSQKFKSKLQELIENEYEKIKRDNKQRFELFHSTVINYVQDGQKKYEALMKDGMNRARTDEQLENLHKRASQEAMNFLKEKFPAKNCSENLKEYEEKLEKDIAGTFDELKYLFEMEQEKKDVTKERVLLDCIKYYHDEMQTHCNNAPFIQPEQLDEFNEQSVSFALNTSIEKFKLTSDQVLELEEEMRKLYEKYQVENDMKLNYGKGVIPAIGIDLGTTYCCVAVYINGEVIIIPNQNQGNAETTASYVMYDTDGSVASFGNDAKQNAFRNPENTIYDAKRILGRKIHDKKLQTDMKFWPFKVQEDEGVPKININGQLFYPEQISAQLLAEFRSMTEKHLGLPSGSITKAVITVPAYFNDGQRQATIDAGQIAGLEVLTILNEPTAAAIAYSLKRLDHSARKVLIYDLGGGTFDVAILDVDSQNINALAVGGDTHLGGEDFDKNMMDYCASVFQAENNGIDPLAGKDSSNKKEKDDAQRRISRLRGRCEAEKRNLASARSATVSIDAFYGDKDLVVEVTREKFEEMNEPLFKRTIDIVEKALKEAKVEKEEIEDIILVGGSTRIPRVQELLSDFFGGKSLNYSIHPDQAVAYGAAVKAAIINGGQARGTNIVATDVAPFSLGIELHSGKLSVIIPKNTTVPFKTVKSDYTTVEDNQTTIVIKVYQGDDEVKAANNELLGEFLLKGIPPGPQGKELVDVSMEIDAMGVLHVEAVCQSTGKSNRIAVTANKQRMTNEQKAHLAKSVRAA